MRHFRTFPSPGITAEDPPVSRTRCLAHETTLADSFVSRTRRSAHETTSEGPSVSRTRRLANETTSEGHSVSRTRRLAHETSLEGHSVSRMRRFTHETTSADPPVSRMRLFAHDNLGRPFREQIAAFHSRDCRERHTRQPRRFFSELRELYGNSTGAPRCRRGETRASATHRETWCLSGR